MRVEYTGRHQTEIPAAIRGLLERRLEKLSKVLHGITHAHVILSRDKHRQAAEVSVHSPHLVLTAAEETADLSRSVGIVMDRLTRQAHRHMEKRRQSHRRAPARIPKPPTPSGHEPRVIRSRPRPPRAMTVEEAADIVRSSKDDILVFRDQETEKVNVLYKRRDGNLGLIEPEV